MARVLAFVDAPVATPTTLLSLSDGDPFRLRDFSLGAPSFDGDPDSIGAEYGYRSVDISLRLVQVAPDRTEASTAIAGLSRLLLSARTWLMFRQSDASEPVFLRVYASAPSALEWVYSEQGVYDVDLALTAGSFLYGELETVGPYTLLADPTPRVNQVNDPSMVTVTGHWSGVGCSVAKTTAQASSGTSSLALTSSASTMYAQTELITVVAGGSYAAQGKFRAATTGRLCHMRIYWYNAAGSLISFSSGSTVTDTTVGWTLASLVATAPALTVSARVAPYVAAGAAGEVHYVDSVMLEAGSTVRTYGDGNTTGWRFVGTANASYSRANSAFYPLPDILGDAPAPAVVSLSPSVDWTGFAPLISVAALDGTALNMQYAVKWETGAFTQGVDTATAADTSMSNDDRSTVTFATQATLATRVYGSVPVVPQVGTYKVLLRVQKSDTTSVFTLVFGQGVGTSQPYYGNTITFSRSGASAGATGSWVDLGEFTFPFGATTPEVGEADTASTPYIYLRAARVSGAGSLHLDAFVLVPVDTAVTEQVRTMVMQFADVGPEATQFAVLDGDNNRYALKASNGTIQAAIPPRLFGGFPELVPGADNYVQLFHQTLVEDLPATVSGGAGLSTSANVTFTYYPRYLHLRPDGA